MLRINCPFCGLRDHEEFSYEGDASISYPALDNHDEEACAKTHVALILNIGITAQGAVCG